MWRWQQKDEKDAESVSKDASSSSTEANKTTSETRSEKYITFIVLQRMWCRWTQLNDLKNWLRGWCYFNQWDEESKQCWDLGDTARTLFSWELENSRTNTELEFWWTRSGETLSIGQTTTANAPYECRSQSTNNMCCWWVYASPTRDMRTNTLKRNTDQSRNSRNPKRTTYKLWWTSMRNWDQVLVLNVSVLGCTHSKRELREETRWSNVRWYKTSQHSTRCTEKTLEKQTTYRTPKGTEKQLDYILVDRNICIAAETLKQKTWSTWEATTEVLWHTLWLQHPRRKSHKNTHIAKKKIKTAESTKSQHDEKTEIRWSRQIRRALHRTRKKNQAWSRNRSRHTEAENDWVFDNVEATRRSYRRSSRSITPTGTKTQTPLLQWRRDLEDLLWNPQQHAIRMKTRTPQSPNSNMRMAVLLWKTQHHAIRMKTRMPQLQEQSKLKADSLLKQQQHAIVVQTHAAAAASKEKAKRTEAMSRLQENQNERPMKETKKSEEAKQCERRQTPTERLEQEDQKVHQRQKKIKTTRKDTADSLGIQRHQK